MDLFVISFGNWLVMNYLIFSAWFNFSRGMEIVAGPQAPGPRMYLAYVNSTVVGLRLIAEQLSIVGSWMRL